MTKLYTLIIVSTLFLACSHHNEVSPEEQIYFPEAMLTKASSGEIRMLQEIKNKDRVNYADCIQLAITYASYKEDSKVISYWLNKSFALNPAKSRETLCYLKDKHWELTTMYEQEVNTVLTHCDASRVK